METRKNPRPFIDEALIAPFRGMKDVLSLSCVVGDAMERNQVMDHEMKPRGADKKIIGPAVTVKLTAGDIVDCLDVFAVTRPGDVVVIDAFGELETSIWGGLMSSLALRQGLRALLLTAAAGIRTKRSCWDSRSYRGHMARGRPIRRIREGKSRWRSTCLSAAVGLW